MNKFSWSALTYDDIEWEMQVKFISNQSYSKQKNYQNVHILLFSFREK